MDVEPSVLHFSGHGAGEQGLHFQSDQGSPVALGADGLLAAIQADTDSLRLVFLNACFSKVQAEALKAHIPCVIGMPRAVADPHGILYAAIFYRALASAKSVVVAHRYGLTALGYGRLAGAMRDANVPGSADIDGRALAPELLVRPDVDAEGVYVVTPNDEPPEPIASGAHDPQKAVLVLTLKADLREIDADLLTVIIEVLRLRSKDLALNVLKVEEGSVRLTLALSPSAARVLLEQEASGQLAEVCGFPISSIVETQAAAVKIAEARATASQARHVVAQRVSGLVAGVGHAGRRGSGRVFGSDVGSIEVGTGADLATLDAALKDAEPLLMRLALRLCGNAYDAEDLVQETFARALAGIPADVRNFRAWLARILHNEFIDRARAKRPRPIREPLDSKKYHTQLEPDGPEPEWTRITVADIRNATDQLEAVYREVYVLHTFEHWSYDEIARKLGISRVAVGTRLHRARKKLREILLDAQVGDIDEHDRSRG